MKSAIISPINKLDIYCKYNLIEILTDRINLLIIQITVYYGPFAERFSIMYIHVLHKYEIKVLIFTIPNSTHSLHAVWCIMDHLLFMKLSRLARDFINFYLYLTFLI